MTSMTKMPWSKERSVIDTRLKFENFTNMFHFYFSIYTDVNLAAEHVITQPGKSVV